ncbi:MAG: phosphotransferase [Hoeflea sp.]|uniref:aminoglycoside phosphotransferase family protein n=1 Tax=Hoeflea sp. TaxID=1940281 RepID=UPI0027310626|nr:phosphotransferase [Hoeflea sp.]MDP2119133.1 phosphotransferase [Hoeflea sp.]MDZ7602220.1 phosphotransferase [Hoeflea sp.]
MTSAARSALNIAPPVSAFLARHGLANARLEPLAGDASSRRYFRLPDRGLLLMEDREDLAGFAAYVRLSRHLLSLGLSAPRVHGADPSNGLGLVEDFGAGTYAKCLSDGASEADLYVLAVDALLHLHQDARGAQIASPRFDLSAYLAELDIFAQWFAPEVNPALDRAFFAMAFRTLWAEALAPVGDMAETLVLRDFHVDNLMFLPARTGVARCGLLDFQDGILGPCEYDLVSLLQDARRDLAPGLEEDLLSRYIAGAPAALGGETAIRRRYALLGAQRHARIAGVFMRLCRRDGKPQYLSYLPRVLRQLEQALIDAGLGPIKDYLDTELPGWAAHGAAPAQDLKGMIHV